MNQDYCWLQTVIFCPLTSACDLCKGYGHSVIFFAYFRMILSSLKMKRDRLTERQFCLTGIGLYMAIVRALWAIVCLYILCPPGGPGCRLTPLPGPAGDPPPPYRVGRSSSKRAILETRRFDYRHPNSHQTESKEEASQRAM